VNLNEQQACAVYANGRKANPKVGLAEAVLLVGWVSQLNFPANRR
jgi:hypothetical protein